MTDVSGDTAETDLTAESGGEIHTDEPPVTDAPEDTAPYETSAEPADTTAEAAESAEASTTVIEVTDAAAEPAENN